ncbi:pyrimidine dimer DNA glycosylase/endonuclease V [Arcanobacterium hippocoleae]|uniref:DNA lyase n=1 Tax=Arcanobacterium hippocoleae TaxID=149017 RepID=A0ABU1T3G2_9ACTO|nr:pyrimidine dimer DNA glycosylase/endonuclease V [Arcanobacterium hippocoleae]MDR6939791.1 hypothetical protein [Arcanobacterium hippocoleae]
MRIWSIHPAYLDRAGLLACWRETLLAQKVLQGLTKGYKHHPQLQRFREHATPLAAIGTYLHTIHREASTRGYNFDATKIRVPQAVANELLLTGKITVSNGQLAYEHNWLWKKLSQRSPATLQEKLWQNQDILPNPLFHVVDGGIADWEKLS